MGLEPRLYIGLGGNLRIAHFCKHCPHTSNLGINDASILDNNPRLWDWGAGVFTKVFSDNLKDENFKLYTIDPDDAANIITTTMCGDDDNVIVIQGFSSDFLNTIDFKIDFLYMDHMESSEEASIQHLKDCELIINNNLMSDNGIILIDDVGDNLSCTKGKYSIPYLMKHNFTVLIHEYQVLMVRETREHLDP